MLLKEFFISPINEAEELRLPPPALGLIKP
jgi:hypothetical protein